MLAKHYCMSKGIGVSKDGLPSFDKALIEAGIGNYNLVRLSSILPAGCIRMPVEDLPLNLKEGSLLPTAYATITSDVLGERITSGIAVGIPEDVEKVGVIMEYSAVGISENDAEVVLKRMVQEAFEIRGWKLDHIVSDIISTEVKEAGKKYTTFACIAEW